MGRRKIEIKLIEDKSTRKTTFKKRKQGLFKKAMELSILTECDVHVIVFNDGELHEYGSMDPKRMMRAYLKAASTPHERYDNGDYEVVNGNFSVPPKRTSNVSEEPEPVLNAEEAPKRFHEVMQAKMTASPPILQYKQRRKLLASPNPKMSPNFGPMASPQPFTFESQSISFTKSSIALHSPKGNANTPIDHHPFNLLTPKDFENGIATPQDLLTSIPKSSGNVTPNLERILNMN